MARITAKANPIGIMPENIWRKKVIRERIQELQAAITRHEARCLPVDPDWQNEFYKRRDELLQLLDD